MVGEMSKEKLEKKCEPCQVCFGAGYWTGYDEDMSEIKTSCEFCMGYKCFKVQENGIQSETYDGRCDGSCGHYRNDI